MSDVLVETIIASLKTCLCNAITTQPSPPQLCEYRLSGPVPYDASITVDQCCQGIAYVSFGDSWASANSFPEQDSVRQSYNAIYKSPAIGLEFKIGIIRCAPVGTDTEPPTATDYQNAVFQSIRDNASLWTAACCFRRGYQDLDAQLLGFSVILGRQNAGSPQGGCIERSMTIQAQIPNNCYNC